LERRFLVRLNLGRVDAIDAPALDCGKVAALDFSANRIVVDLEHGSDLLQGEKPAHHSPFPRALNNWSVRARLSWLDSVRSKRTTRLGCRRRTLNQSFPGAPAPVSITFSIDLIS